MPIESMNQRLNRRLVDVSYVRRRLPRFPPRDDAVWVDEPERVDHDLALYRLDGVDHDGYRAVVEGFKRLGGLY